MAGFADVPPSILGAKKEHKPSDTKLKIDSLLAAIDEVLAPEGPEDALAAGG